MSDLTRFRDHARHMAAGERPERLQGPDLPLTAPDRALWARLADEIDAYLDRPTEAVDLFGEVTAEPVRETEDA